VVSVIRIAVIGVGPRGLSVFERVISHARLAGPPIELLLIEPGELGFGIHQVKQPDYLLLNTIAAQLTIFSDESMTPGAPVTTGPSFFEWCRLRRGAVRFDDFLPRRLLGEYLQWAVGELFGQVPERLTVRHLPAVARAVRQDRAGATVTLADGTGHRVDLAVVTTGHGLARPAPLEADGRIAAPYPLPEQVDRIPAGSAVAFLGTGLTAMDVIAALTVGRGGEFTGHGYRASGREPRIVLANRSGRLPCARPATTADRQPAPARFLTEAAVAALREDAPGGQLDFQRDIEPLIYREVVGRMASATPAQIEVVGRVLRPDREEAAGYRQYLERLTDLARSDLREAGLGLGVSPVKEGLEVLRDHRGGLRAAVDPPGLTAQSHRYFMSEYVPLVNRVVIGPQKERIEELLFLIDAGIVIPGPGPQPELTRTGPGWTLSSTRLRRPHRIAVDQVVRANLTWPSADPDLDPVAASLRSWVAPGPGGGLRLDRDGFAVPSAGDAGVRAVAVLGPPAEGASYYNHYVPSPGVWSRALTDVDRVLRPLLGAVPAQKPAS
jgi:FAD-NAD(P)-binding